MDPPQTHGHHHRPTATTTDPPRGHGQIVALKSPPDPCLCTHHRPTVVATDPSLPWTHPRTHHRPTMGPWTWTPHYLGPIHGPTTDLPWAHSQTVALQSPMNPCLRTHHRSLVVLDPSMDPPQIHHGAMDNLKSPMDPWLRTHHRSLVALDPSMDTPQIHHGAMDPPQTHGPMDTDPLLP